MSSPTDGLETASEPRPLQIRAASAPPVADSRRFGAARTRAASAAQVGLLPSIPLGPLVHNFERRSHHVPCTSPARPCTSPARPIHVPFVQPSCPPRLPRTSLHVPCASPARSLDPSHLIRVISSESSYPVRYIRVIYSQPPSESLGSGGRHTSAPLVIEKVPFRCHGRVTRLIAVPVTT